MIILALLFKKRFLGNFLVQDKIRKDKFYNGDDFLRSDANIQLYFYTEKRFFVNIIREIWIDLWESYSKNGNVA